MDPEKYLNALINYEKIPGYDYNLADYKEFLTRIGAPQNNLKNVILIAGTKGKGSTAAIINSCLFANGYKVGLYTSPHLEKINERIKINNRQISNKELNKYIKIIKPNINLKNRVGPRTYFEVLTTIALLHFLENKTDFNILEIGLGGRLDATNVTKPLISVITKIGYDHTDLLGSKLSQIAYEKAGIIRRRSKLITIHQRPAAEQTIRKIAHLRKTSITYADEAHHIRSVAASIIGSRFEIDGALGDFNVFMPLPGQHQIQNLSIALAVLNELKKMGFKIETGATKIGINKTRLHGRFEIISRRPLIIYDCAHNQDSFAALNNSLKLLGTKRFSLIFGSKNNKDISYCVKHIFPKATEVLLVQIASPLAMDPLEIYTRAKKYQGNIIIAPNVKWAVKYLRNQANRASAIVITGSFYLWPGTKIKF